MLIIIGSNDALLEGLAQLLVGAAHRVIVTRSVEEAAEIALQKPPMLLIADRAMVAGEAGTLVAHIPLAPGGAVVLYRVSGEQVPLVAIPHGVARITLADLELPLERQRLVALAQYVKTRAKESGRARSDTPPEQHAR
jgi:hypothetical protein